MIVVAYLGSQCKKFHVVGWNCWVFTSVYLESFNGWMWFCNRSKSEGASHVMQISVVWRRPSQCLEKSSGKKVWAVHRCLKSSKSLRPKKAKTGKEQTQLHAHNFDIKGAVRFEVFTPVTMKNGVFWDVTPYGSCKNRRFGGLSASFIRVTRIGELGTTLAVTSKYFFAACVSC
jgi:hypothetical protein